jgi:beta-lactamase regulating signal transducer with metallopeptidase domain
MLVLVKLVTPPVWNVPVAIGRDFETEDAEPEGREALAAIGSQNIHPDANSSVPFPRPHIDASAVTFDVTTSAPVVQPMAEAASTEEAAALATSPHSTPPSPPPAKSIDWIPLLVNAWIITSALWLLVAVARIVRFHRLVRRSAVADAALRQRITGLATQLGLRRAPDVRLLDGNISPMVWPLTWKRSLLLPRKLLNELTPSQLDTVIAHELAHLIRRDDLVRFLEAGVTSLFWWNPVVWWSRRELHRAEEDCCDALVVCSLPDSRRQYGEALLRAAEIITFGRSIPALASAFAQQRFLKRRIEMILTHEFRRGLSWPFKVLLLALAAAILPLAATAVSQEGTGTSSNTAGEPEASQFHVTSPAVPQSAPASTTQLSGRGAPTTQHAPLTTDPTLPRTGSPAAAIQTAPAGSASTGDPLSTTPITALPGSDLLGDFSWDNAGTKTAYVDSDDGWRFVDLDHGRSATLTPSEAREREVEGYDIRLRSWTDEIDGRTQFVAVLLDIDYQEWRNGLDGLREIDLSYLAQVATVSRSDAIHPGIGIFRTSEGNLGVLEFTTEDGQGVLKYQLIATVGDPVIPAGPDSVGTTSPSIPTSPSNPLLDPSVSQGDAEIPMSRTDVAADPVLQPAGSEPTTTITWPAPQPGAANQTPHSISTDPEVQQLELELLTLDVQAIEIQLDGERQKLDYVRRLFEDGGAPEGEYQAQQVAVHLLQIELRRAQIRRQLYEAQIQRQQGTGTSGNALPQEETPANLPADPEASTSDNLFDSGFLPRTEPAPLQETGDNTIQNPNDSQAAALEERQRTLDALRALNEASLQQEGDPGLQRRIELYEEAFRLQAEAQNIPVDPDAGSNTPPVEVRFPRPVDPTSPLAIVQGVLVQQGQPLANQVIWIVGDEEGEAVLYQDGPTGDDGRFEFTDVPVGRPWRVFIPIENGPAGIASNWTTLTSDDNAEIEVIVEGETVTVEQIGDDRDPTAH